jgi:hypothetical protein
MACSLLAFFLLLLGSSRSSLTFDGVSKLLFSDHWHKNSCLVVDYCKRSLAVPLAACFPQTAVGVFSSLRPHLHLASRTGTKRFASSSSLRRLLSLSSRHRRLQVHTLPFSRRTTLSVQTASRVLALFASPSRCLSHYFFLAAFMLSIRFGQGRPAFFALARAAAFFAGDNFLDFFARFLVSQTGFFIIFPLSKRLDILRSTIPYTCSRPQHRHPKLAVQFAVFSIRAEPSIFSGCPPVWRMRL